MHNHSEWSKASRRTGGTPSARDTVPFAPRNWPLKPRAKVPREDPTDAVDAVNPAKDKSRSGGSSSGDHGRGRGPSARDTGVPSRDVTQPPGRRNEHHCDDHSEPLISKRAELDKRQGVRSIRSRRRDEPGRMREELAADTDDEDDCGPVAFTANSSVHTAARITMDRFFDPEKTSAEPNLPGTRPLRKVTPSKRGRAGHGVARSRTLPGAQPETGQLPDTGFGNG